ncbi:PucR family transcriptional regulator [Sporomusa sphaeroides]|uniref:Purine catabolism regulatory protein n=1 Tax=Sporomusa sphaeroides DSM 2875 TaxID=1337886 RepID=A0ABM9W5D6_9FIRM|nr:PucR family transcriptional regulator [Sporomusa sphaeroides]OLS55265.1 purine catabolism regulatory protein [Sporomusa sphaeroides DSM 2875]CVK20336.1 Purine catabolism regulatory protein [Sporomusa sphaeroides DSM 2875]
MHLTIKDVLQLFQEQSVNLVAGANGLNNIILSTNIMDAPDIANWAKPGDLILTTGYTFKDDPVLQEQLIRELAAVGIAGLAIKTKRFLPEVPLIIKALADELSLPIIELPLTLSLSEILNPIISSIAARQSYLLGRSNEIHKTLTNVAIKGGGLNAIIACLGKLTQCPVGCYDIHGSVLSHWLPESIPGVDKRIFKQLDKLLLNQVTQNEYLQAKLSQAKTPYTQQVTVEGYELLLTSLAIMSDNEFFGHISLLQPTDAFLDINCMALEHTCTVAALDFLKKKAVSESHRLYSRDILEHILFGDLTNQTTTETLATSKLSKAKLLECSVIEINESEGDVNLPVMATRLYKTTQQLVSAQHPLSLISERTGKIIVLIAFTGTLTRPDPEIYTQLLEAFKEHYTATISIGVGTAVTDIRSVRQSYQDALTCLNLGRITKAGGHITYPYEIASYALLENPDTASLLTHVYEATLAKLENSDTLHGTELVKTLEKYLEYDKNLTDSAKELYIHRNTLTNRLERIHDITDLDFSNREFLFGLRLALRQRKLRRQKLR